MTHKQTRMRLSALLLVVLFAYSASSWPGPFTCCSGEESCNFAVNDPVVCSALGDLYYSTNGAGWLISTRWSDAAAGIPTDFCTFFTSSDEFDFSINNGLCTTYGFVSNLCALASLPPACAAQLPPSRAPYTDGAGHHLTPTRADCCQVTTSTALSQIA